MRFVVKTPLIVPCLSVWNQSLALDIYYILTSGSVMHCFVNPGVGCEVVLAKPLQMCVNGRCQYGWCWVGCGMYGSSSTVGKKKKGTVGMALKIDPHSNEFLLSRV